MFFLQYNQIDNILYVIPYSVCVSHIPDIFSINPDTVPLSMFADFCIVFVFV